ncbi:MAG: hypothetical protein R2844_13165 [Caldilineales bacterium]
MINNNRFAHLFSLAGGSGARFLPDLMLWYEWHNRRGTLPAGWQGWSLPQIACSLGVPAWLTVCAFGVDHGDVAVQRVETPRERLVRYCAAAGELTERWTLGPDGDWWQTEYSVKSPSDLHILLQIVSQRRYDVDPTALERKTVEVGDDGIVALELPRRPFSQVFLEWLGWSDGLLLFFDAQDLVAEVVAVLEDKMQALVEQITVLPGKVVVSPDNLDAQFISPALFQRYLAYSYRRTAMLLHGSDKMLLAGTGGPIGRLLRPLADASVDGVEGVCGPPQSDATLSEARLLTGPAFTLWGGIPQDALLPDFDQDQFEAMVVRAARRPAPTRTRSSASPMSSPFTPTWPVFVPYPPLSPNPSPAINH